MREQTLSLEAHGGDRVSSEFLAATLHRRAPSLVDDPSSTLFFGRIDRGADAGVPGAPTPPRHRPAPPSAGTSAAATWPTPPATRWSSTGGPRCPRAFYRASRTDADGRPAAPPVRLRPRHAHGVRGRAPDRPGRGDRRERILASEIERPATGPMRDIVATIQPEQDVIVRADVTDHDLRAGRAGHRQDRGGPAPRGVAALRVPRAAGPRRRPGDRPQPRVPRPHRRRAPGPRRGRGQPRDHRGAGRPACRSAASTAPKPLCSRATRAWPRCCTAPCGRHVSAPTEPLVLPRGAHKWRVPAYEVADIVEELRARGVRYGAARQMLPHRLAHAVLLRMERAGDSPDDRVQDAVARAAAVRRYADGVAGARPGTVLFRLLVRPRRPRRAADGLLTTTSEQALLLGHAAARPRQRTLVGGRRGAARRGRATSRAHAQPRARGARRGAGPLADAAAGGRPALLDRLGDGARRHRPGHDAVGDRLLGVVAAPPGQAGRPRRGARPRVPRARRRSSSTPPSCCPPWLPASARRSRSARTRGGWTSSRGAPTTCSTGWWPPCTTAR